MAVRPSGDFSVLPGANNMLASNDFETGLLALAGALILPYPEKKDTFIYISGDFYNYQTSQNPPWWYVGFKPILYSIFTQGDSGTKMIEYRKILFDQEVVVDGHFVAVRHGNGRDWWVMQPIPFSDRYIAYSVTPNGISVDHIDHTGQHITDTGIGQTCFSPDGKRFVQYRQYGIFNVSPPADSSCFFLFDFDRCAGHLTPKVQRYWPKGELGGAAFSPNSRYLYIARWDTVFQYDVEAADILSTETVVAKYDGFLDTNIIKSGLPVRFFLMKLGPDGRIYINIANFNLPWLHVIEHPDEKGVACEVKQHAIELPVWNAFSMPNIPNYRLGKELGSPCDTITASHDPPSQKEVEMMSIFPNPTREKLFVNLASVVGEPVTFRLCDLKGRLLLEWKLDNAPMEAFELSVKGLPSGQYVLFIYSATHQPVTQKVVIFRE